MMTLIKLMYEDARHRIVCAKMPRWRGSIYNMPIEQRRRLDDSARRWMKVFDPWFEENRGRKPRWHHWMLYYWAWFVHALLWPLRRRNRIHG